MFGTKLYMYTSTLMVSNATYYSELHNALSFWQECDFWPDNVIYVVYCPYNLFDFFTPKS